MNFTADLISRCRGSNPAAPASQSGLRHVNAEKRRGTAAPTSGGIVTQIQLGGSWTDSLVRILHAQPRSRLKLEVRRQKVKSARNRADPYIRLLLVTRPKKYDTFVV